MGTSVKFLGWTGSSQRVCDGDEYIEYNFTEASSANSVLAIQRNASTFFELLNDSGVKVSSASSYIGNSTPSIDIQGLLDHPAGILRVYDKTGGQDALVVKRVTNATGRITEFVVGNAAQAGADSVGARFSYNAQSATPLGKVASFGHTGAGPGYAYNELSYVHSDGTLHMSKSSGANLVWDTHGGGTIGTSLSAGSPSTIYAQAAVRAPTLYGGSSSTPTLNSSLTNFSMTLTGDSPGSNNKVIYADDGTVTKPAIQFDESTNRWQYRVDGGGAFANFGSVTTWDDLYANDKALDINAEGIEWNQTASGQLYAFKLRRTGASTTKPLFIIGDNSNPNPGGCTLYMQNSTNQYTHVVSVNGASARGISIDGEYNVPGATNTMIRVYDTFDSDGASYRDRWKVDYYGRMAMIPRLAATGTGLANALFSMLSARHGSDTDLVHIGPHTSLIGANPPVFRLLASGSLFMQAYSSNDAARPGLVIAQHSTGANSYIVRFGTGDLVESGLGTYADRWKINESGLATVTPSSAAAALDIDGAVGDFLVQINNTNATLANRGCIDAVGKSQFRLATATSPATGTYSAVESQFTSTSALTNANTVARAFFASLTDHASDAATSKYYGIYVDSTTNGPGTKYGVYAVSGLTYGLFSASKSAVDLGEGTTTTSQDILYIHGKSGGITVGNGLRGLQVNLAGHGSDTKNIYGASFTLDSPSGAGGASAIRVDTSWNIGLDSATKCVIDLGETGTTSSQNLLAVHGKSAGITAGGGLRGLQVNLAGHGSDTQPVYGASFTLDSPTASADARALNIDSSWNYGLYSGSVGVFEVNQGDAPGAIFSAIGVNTGALTGTNERTGISTSLEANAGDAAGSKSVVYDAAINAAGSGTRIGFRASANFSRSIDLYAPGNLSSVVTKCFSVVHADAGALGASAERQSVSVGVSDNAGDNATSWTNAFYGTVVSDTGPGTLACFKSASGFTYGLYSESKTYVKRTVSSSDYGSRVEVTANGTIDAVSMYVKAANGTGLTGAGTMMNIYSEISGGSGDASTAYKYALYSSVSGDGATAAPMMYGIYSTRGQANSFGANKNNPLNFFSLTSSGTGLGASEFDDIVQCRFYGDADDSASAAVSCVRCVTDAVGSAIRYGTNIEAGFTYGLYSKSKSCVEYPSSGNLSSVDQSLLYLNANTGTMTTATLKGLYVRFNTGSQAAGNTVYGAQLYGASDSGSAATYGLVVNGYWDYSIYTEGSPSLFVRSDGTISSSDTYLVSGVRSGTLAASVGASVFRCELTSNGIGAGSYWAGYYAVYVNAAGTNNSVAFMATANWKYGIYSLGERHYFERSAGVYDASTSPVVEIYNYNTTESSANHSMVASIARSSANIFAAAVNNSAVTTTERALGFTATKTNVRHVPIADGCPYNSGLAAGADYYFTGRVWRTVGTDNGKQISFPLYLPHGCTITQIRFQVRCGADTGQPPTGTSRQFMEIEGAQLDGSASSLAFSYFDNATGQAQYTWSSINLVVDNSTYAYFLQYCNAQASATTYSAVAGIEVTYTMRDVGAAPGW